MPGEDQQGMIGALSQLAYGQSGSPYANLPKMLEQVLPNDEGRAEWLAFGAGVGAPTRTGALTEALSAGMGAQSEARLARDKLRAQYIPLIMQMMGQQQQMTIAAANSSRDYLKDINPKMDLHLAALRTGDRAPTYAEAVSRVMQLAQEYQVPPHIALARIQSLPQDQAELAAHLDRLAVAGAGADKLVPTVGNNAAGQPSAVSPVRGTIAPLGAPGQRPQPPAGNPNPTSADVKFEEHRRGDVPTYEAGLRARVDAYETMLSRMNEQAEFVRNFQPGKYAGMAGGIAAAIKDIGGRLPGVDKKVLEQMAHSLIGAPPNSPQALAAQQLFEQLAQQETLAQLKTALGEGQRMNQMEYANFAKANFGQQMDPATFKGLRDFYYKEAANAINQYEAWAKYVRDPAVKTPSVTEFDAGYRRKAFDHLLKGDRGVLPSPGGAEPKFPGYTPPNPSAAPAPSAPAPATEPPGVAPNLRDYEPGARIGPTGRVYIIEKGVPREAKLVRTATPAPKRLSAREQSGKIGEE